MAIRVLCLHGQGTNSKVMEKQTEDVRDMLPHGYEFYFYDGKHQDEPAPGVSQFFPPPYVTWYNTPTTAKVADAHHQVREIVEKHGPFDAVLGFSQGAAVAASLLLHQELDSEAPLFKAAIFIGSPVPFASQTDVGIDMRKYFSVSDEAPNKSGRPTICPSHLVADQKYMRNPAQLGENISCDGVEYNMFHPSTDSVRIKVPTGHIYGTKDPWFLHSKDLVELCSQDGRKVFQHDGGHEVPRSYTEEICDLIETVFAKIR